MNTKFKRICAMELLKNCKAKEAEYEKYIAAFKLEDWSELDCYDYADKCASLVYYEGKLDAVKEVIYEIEGWC